MKEREIRTRDDEIREKRREISQEDAESALRVEMTEMRIKDLAERAQKMVADAKNRSERSEMTWKWVCIFTVFSFNTLTFYSQKTKSFRNLLRCNVSTVESSLVWNI